MGAYKDKTGKTRVGNAISKIGSFFSGIFTKKTTTNPNSSLNEDSTLPSTDATTTTTKTKTKVGSFLEGIGNLFTSSNSVATPPISGTQASGTGLGSLGIAVGYTVLGWLGQKLPDATTAGTTEEQAQQAQQNDQQAQKTGNGLIFIIVGTVLAIIGYFYFKNKNK